MNKAGGKFVAPALALTGAVLASALMLKFTANGSWLAFIGWVIFFVAIQSPMFIGAPSSQGSCAAWLARLRKRR